LGLQSQQYFIFTVHGAIETLNSIALIYSQFITEGIRPINSFYDLVFNELSKFTFPKFVEFIEIIGLKREGGLFRFGFIEESTYFQVSA
jgi:hypothetical protein